MWLTCLIVGALGTANLVGQGASAGLVFVTCLWGKFDVDEKDVLSGLFD